MEHKCTIATHTGITTIKHGRFVDVVSMGEPVPVLPRSVQHQHNHLRRWTHRLVAIVPALVSQGLFIRPNKVAMPCKKETIAMYEHGLVNVNSDKVIVTRLCCWSPC